MQRARCENGVEVGSVTRSKTSRSTLEGCVTMCNRSIVWTIAALTVLAEATGPSARANGTDPSGGPVPETAVVKSLDRVAEGYVKLALALGEHDPLYVDAYNGPPEWRAKAREEKKPLVEIEKETAPLLSELARLDCSGEEEIVRLRRDYLVKALESLAARARMLGGTRYTFDEEAAALYDVVAPHFDDAYFAEALARVDSLVPPGEGSLLERLERLKEGLIIPKEKLDTVFSAAIAEARSRTKERIALPENESFTVEYVTNQSWSAYNWYKGDNHSVIQVNMDLPVYLSSMIGWACHEGYPGHHVQNVIFDARLVRERGWVEFTIQPLFCPQGPLNEGAANFGIEVAFPGNERLAFERDVLCPLAGLDPVKAEIHFKIREASRALDYAKDMAARRYLDGEITAEDAAQFLSTNGLMTPARARKLVTFIDQYRSYIVNYDVGYDLVKNFIEGRGGTEDRPEMRWKELGALLSAPRVPSALLKRGEAPAGPGAEFGAYGPRKEVAP